MGIIFFVAGKLFGPIAAHILASPTSIQRYSRLTMLVGSLGALGAIGLLWAQSATGPMPLWQSLANDPVAWIGIALAVGYLICLIMLVWQPAGTYHILFCINLIILILAWLGMRQRQLFKPGFGQYIALTLSVIFALLTFALMAWDSVPLSSPLARFVYLRRWRHLLTIGAVARQHQCQLVGPGGETHALVAQGRWHERDLIIESSIQIGMRALSRPSYLQISLNSYKRLWPLTLKAGSLKLKRTAQLTAMRGVPSNATDGNSWRYPAKHVLKLAASSKEAILLSPKEGEPADHDLRRFQQILEELSKNLPSRTLIHTVRNQIFFEHTSDNVMQTDANEIGNWIAALDKLLTLMETSSFTS